MNKIKIQAWIAEKEQLPTAIEADVKIETEKGVMIRYKNRDIWLPRKHVEYKLTKKQQEIIA